MRRQNDPEPTRPATPHHSFHLGISRRIPLISLKYVLAVAEYLNFGHAAAALGTSQSSVSTRIRMLEADLGLSLFERRHRGVHITEAGRQFAAEIAIGIGNLDRAIMTAGAICSGAVGRLAIGVQSTVGSGFLAELRKRHADRWPAIDVETVEGASGDLLRQLREGALDVCFLLDRVHAPDCHSRSLWSEHLAIAFPERHPLIETEDLHWRDLAAETFVVRPGGAGPQIFEHIVRRIAEAGGVPRVRMCDVGRDTLLHLVAAGEGITLTSETTAGMPMPGVVFRAIADETEQACFGAVWSPHNRSPALARLIELAVSLSRERHRNSVS